MKKADEIQNLMHEYKQEICDLKFKISCISVENQNLKLQIKQLEERIQYLVNQSQKKDKNIIELENRTIKIKQSIRNQKNEQLKQFSKEKLEYEKNIKLLQQELTNNKNQNRKLLQNYVDTISSVIGFRTGQKIQSLLPKIKQLKEQSQLTKIQLNRLKEQYNQASKKQIIETQNLSQEFSEKDKLIMMKNNENAQLEKINEELIAELKKVQQTFDIYKYNVEKEMGQATKLIEENEGLIRQQNKLRNEILSKNRQINRLKEQIKNQKTNLLNQYDQINNKVVQIQNQKNELRNQIITLTESTPNSRNAQQIQEEFQFLISKIKIKKDTKIKKMVSQKYWNNSQSLIHHRNNRRSYEQSILSLEH